MPLLLLLLLPAAAAVAAAAAAAVAGAGAGAGAGAVAGAGAAGGGGGGGSGCDCGAGGGAVIVVLVLVLVLLVISQLVSQRVCLLLLVPCQDCCTDLETTQTPQRSNGLHISRRCRLPICSDAGRLYEMVQKLQRIMRKPF